MEENQKKNIVSIIVNFIAKIFGIKQKKNKKEKPRTEDIYPMW